MKGGELEEAFRLYLERKLGGGARVSIKEFHRIYGGASRETYRVRIIAEGDGGRRERGLILRRDPTGSLIDTDRRSEFLAYRAYFGTDVPVPEALFLEIDEPALERPFFVMAEVEGCSAASPFNADPYGPHRQKIGAQFWTILGHIARRDPAEAGLTQEMEAPALDRCGARELDYWEGVINADELAPQPILRAAIRKLRRAPPPPAPRLAIVHGDYRTGNFLFDEGGTIRAVLDWEMSHLGDPYEDLAWAMDPLWSFRDPERPGGMIPRGEAIRLWEQAAGLKFDPVAFKWWSLFAMVKGLAIWISSSHEFATGTNKDPVLAFSGWFCTATHNRLLAERLARELNEEASHAP